MVSAILRAIDTISEISGRVAAFIVIPNFLALVYEVIARYVFKHPTIWSYDVTYMLYAAHFMLGAAYTLKYRRHTRIDVLYSRFSPRVQAIIDVFCYLLLFFPAMLVLIYGGIGLVHESLIMQERSQATPWRPVVWPFRSLLPLGFFLLFLQGLAEFIRRLKVAVRGLES